MDRYLGELFSPANIIFPPAAGDGARPELQAVDSLRDLPPSRRAGGESVFQYTRGSGQGEGRLHRKRSVGIGGHISAVDVGADGSGNPYEEGMRRELEEEVAIDTPYTSRCVGLINDDETEVGRVHLGVVHLFDVERPAVHPRESEIIECGFRPVPEILADMEGFETWSQICMKALFAVSGTLRVPWQRHTECAGYECFTFPSISTITPRPASIRGWSRRCCRISREIYGNAGSASHAFGAAAKDAVEDARAKVAAAIGARAKEIVWTSGATESNNLAIRGVAERHAARGRHIVSVATEHPAVLDPLATLARRGFEITLLPVIAAARSAGRADRRRRLAAAIRDDTILVSVMLANNEIGAIQPLAEIGRLCKDRGVLLHTDATQAVGKIPVDVEALGVDLMSFTAHKIYGPKGIGALYVRSRGPRVRLEPQIDGGGQEGGLRSGTANVPGIVGFARALELCLAELPAEAVRLRGLRDRLYAGLTAGLSDVSLNGPALDLPVHASAGQFERQFRATSRARR